MNLFSKTAISVAMLSCAYCAAAQESGTTPPQILDYSRDVGISVNEAAQRIEQQTRAGDLQLRAVELLGDTFSGLYVEHVPKYRIVLLTQIGRDQQQARALVTNEFSDLKDLVHYRSVGKSYRRLENEIEALAARLNTSGIETFAYVDTVENTIVIADPNPDEIKSAMEKAGIGGDYKFLKSKGKSKRLATIGAGEKLHCTSGFSVTHSTGVRGVTTAGHCDNGIQVYNGTTLPFKGEREGQDWDVQWHTTPGYTPTNRIYTGSGFVTITAYKGRFGQAVGSYICKYGHVDGRRCGYIRSLNAIGDVPNTTATFVSLGSSTMYGMEGDSGGPVYTGGTGYGLIHGLNSGVHNGVAEWQLIYMAADRVGNSGLGISILLSQ